MYEIPSPHIERNAATSGQELAAIPDELAKALSVTEVKRSFRAILDAAERGERTIVLRHGKPVAAVTPLTEDAPAEHRLVTQPGGLLAAAGLLADWDTIEDDLAAIVASRRETTDRQPPEID